MLSLFLCDNCNKIVTSFKNNADGSNSGPRPRGANHWPGYHTRGVPFHNGMRSAKLRLKERSTNLFVYAYNTSRVLPKHVTMFTMQLELHVPTVLQKEKYRTEINWPRTFSPDVMSFSLLVDE